MLPKNNDFPRRRNHEGGHHWRRLLPMIRLAGAVGAINAIGAVGSIGAVGAIEAGSCHCDLDILHGRIGIRAWLIGGRVGGAACRRRLYCGGAR